MKKTNEQVLRAMMKNLDPIETAILRERILKICDITLSEIESWKPGTAFFVNNNAYRRIVEKIKTLTDFKD